MWADIGDLLTSVVVASQLEHVLGKMDKLCIARADGLLRKFDDVLTYRGNDYVRVIGMGCVLEASGLRSGCRAVLLTASTSPPPPHATLHGRTQEPVPFVDNNALARFGNSLLKPVDVNLMP